MSATSVFSSQVPPPSRHGLATQARGTAVAVPNGGGPATDSIECSLEHLRQEEEEPVLCGSDADAQAACVLRQAPRRPSTGRPTWPPRKIICSSPNETKGDAESAIATCPAPMTKAPPVVVVAGRSGPR